MAEKSSQNNSMFELLNRSPKRWYFHGAKAYRSQGECEPGGWLVWRVLLIHIRGYLLALSLARDF